MIKKHLLTKQKGIDSCSLLPQKWLVCLLTLLATFVGSGRMWAQDVTEWSHDGQKTSLSITASKTDGSSIGTYTGYSLKCDAVTYTSAVKMESKTQIAFSTTSTSTITIGIALKDTYEYKTTNSILFDGAKKTGFVTEDEIIDGKNKAVFLTIPNVEAGNHVIARGSNELGIFYIKVKDTGSSTIGKINYTSVFNVDKSQDYEIGTNQMREFTFICHGNQTPGDKNYLTWALLAHDADDTNTYALLNTVPQVYKNGGSAESTIMYKLSGGSLAEMEAGDWATFRTDMQNAEVNVKVSHSGNKMFVYSIMRANGNTYVYPYEQDINQSSIKVHFTVEGSYLTDFTAKDPVQAATAQYNITYTDGCPEEQKTGCTVTMTTEEGVVLTTGTPIGYGEKIIYTASPDIRVNSMGLEGTNPRTVIVSETTAPYNNEVRPTIQFKGKVSPTLSFSPNPYFTYVGATNVGRADIIGLPGSGWDHLTTTIDGVTLTNTEPIYNGAKKDIATYNSNTGTWTLGTKSGKITASVTMADHDNYGEATASYDFIVKPGALAGSTYNTSLDFTTYIDEAGIQEAFGNENGANGDIVGKDISIDENISIISWAPGIYGETTSSGTTIRLVGKDLVVGAKPGFLITGVRLNLGQRNSNSVNYKINNIWNTATRVDNAVTLGATELGDGVSGISFARTGGSEQVFVKSIEINYIQASFSAHDYSVNLLDIKKTTGMPTMPGATYTSNNEKIVRVDPSTGALTLLKTGMTSISGTVNGVTDSYNITVWADDATETITENGTQYNVTGDGKLPSNFVTSIPYITLQYGASGETAIVRSINGGHGVNVIGAADGNVGSIVPNSETNPTSGTYYVFTPELSGELTVSGYFNATGSHSAWMYEYNKETGAVGTHITNGTWERNTSSLVTNTVNVEAGKTYLLMAVLEAGHENVFWLQSFKFVPNLKFVNKSVVVENKASQAATFTIPAQVVDGTNSGDGTTYSVKVVKDTGSNLSASVSGSTITISSPTDADGGAIIVTATVRSTSGVENSLSYVITVPYIGNHTWNLANMANKTENKTDGHWYLTYEVRRGDEIKDPIVVLQDKVSGDNAKYFAESNGMYINTNGTNNIGLSVTTDHIDYTNATTKKAATLEHVDVVNLLAVTNATVTLPQLKKDWFVKVYLDPHTGNNHGSGCGCEFSVNNLCDLTGKAIDPSHWIMSYGTQWTTNTSYDDKNPGKPYAGCIIFRVAEPGDVSFNFRNNGWDKIVKIEVSNTYSSEMVLGSIATKTVDYLRWNHSWVHREKADGTDAGVNINYNGDPLVRAENAKPIDHNVYAYNDPVTGSHRESNWTSKGGVTYTQVNYDDAKGVGNLKVISDAVYSGQIWDGDWTEQDKYVLNRNESWVVVGKLKEQKYPYTWDFDSYNMAKPEEAVRTTKLMEATVDTTYGYWNGNSTNVLAKVKASASYNSVAKTSNVDTEGWKIFNGSAAGSCNTSFAPAVNGKAMKEHFSYSAANVGTILEQTVTGLEDGLYTVKLQANALSTYDRDYADHNDLISVKDGSTDIAYVFANNVQLPITSRNATSTAVNGEYTMNVQVTGGTLHLGLAKRIPGTNWHTIQIESLTYNQPNSSAGAGDSPFYTIDGAGNKTYDIDIYKPLFANGAQLTHGFEPIRETEGLGISIDNAYFTSANRVTPREQQVVLDGTQLQVNNTNWHVLIPSVNAGMYVFVKGDEPTATTNLENSDIEFAANSANDVYYWKVTAAGDVNLTFASGASIKKIGVTNQIKDITYYGWTTESRDIDIDHNETGSFSANTKAYKLTNNAGWNSTYSVQVENGSKVDLGTGVYVPAGNGIAIENQSVDWNPAMSDTDKSTASKVPLFVPAVNIASHPANMDGNLLLATTKPGESTVTIYPKKVYEAGQYYVMGNYYYRVGKENNKLSENKVWAYPAMYRYMGSAAAPANKAYLYFESAAQSSSKARNSVAIMFDDEEEEATAIDGITTEMDIIDNSNDVYYNVNGQLMNGKPNTRGLYIKNGVKYYNK